jgi:ABC-type branched-subunit amino acid transport system ATPase component
LGAHFLKLSFSNNHISIRQFDTVELPDFVVLTGRNGSGKTHLLQAIKAGHCRLDDFQPHEIQYFNYQNFIAQNTSGQNTLSIEQITAQGFAEFQQNFLPAIQNIYQSLAPQWKSSRLHPDAGAFYGSIEDFWKAKSRNRNQKEHLENYRLLIATWLEAPANIPRTSQFPAIWSVIQKSSLPPHLIDRDTFSRLFVPIMDAGSILGFSLSTLFTKYKISEFNWCHNKFSAGQIGGVRKLQATYRARTPPPWIAINDLLAEMGKMAGSRDTFRFEVTTPADQLIDMQDIQSFTFLAQLINKTTSAICNFEELSSGEKVLLALACSIFYANDLLMLPRALLLDEVDASLHPSMIRTLLDAVQSAFVAKGAKAVVATHSPTTVALASASSLYFVEAGSKQKKIRKTSKKEALALLSEGFVTFDEGLDALKFSGEKLVLFTEGHNRKIIARYFELAGIDGVKMIDTLDDKSGKEQLAHYFQAISALGLNRPFLFVFDCDGASNAEKLRENQNLFKFVIPKNSDNKLAPKGIENAFPESHFESHCVRTERANGDIIRKFDDDRKKAFADKIVKSQNLADFSGLESLKQKIKEILNSN